MNIPVYVKKKHNTKKFSKDKVFKRQQTSKTVNKSTNKNSHGKKNKSNNSNNSPKEGTKRAEEQQE